MENSHIAIPWTVPLQSICLLCALHYFVYCWAIYSDLFPPDSRRAHSFQSPFSQKFCQASNSLLSPVPEPHLFLLHPVQIWWPDVEYCIAVQHCAWPWFFSQSPCNLSSCLGFFAGSKQRIFRTFPYVNLLFWMITVNLEANKISRIIFSRACITLCPVPSQGSCIRQHVSEQNLFFQFCVSQVAALPACTPVWWSHSLLFCFFSFKIHWFLSSLLTIPAGRVLLQGAVLLSSLKQSPLRQNLAIIKWHVAEKKWRRRMYPIETASGVWDGRL